MSCSRADIQFELLGYKKVENLFTSICYERETKDRHYKTERIIIYPLGYYKLGIDSERDLKRANFIDFEERVAIKKKMKERNWKISNNSNGELVAYAVEVANRIKENYWGKI